MIAPLREIAAVPARPALAAALRALPIAFGDRGRRHAEWRANHWAPTWLHAHATAVTARRGGIRWELDLRANVQRSLYFTGHYEPRVHHLLRSAVPPGGVFVEVGAHIGVHALPISRYLANTGGSVIAFEPAPDNATKLRTAAARSGISNLCIVETALGSVPGTARLYARDDYGPHDTGVRSVFGSGEPAFTVPVAVFDDWAEVHALRRMDVVKIGVEGAELDVLAGMSGALRRHRPGLIVIELLEENCHAAGVESADIEAFLADHGYRQHELLEKNAVFMPMDGAR